MKFKTIIAAAMALALMAGTFGAAGINPGTTVFADTAKKTYTIVLNDPGAIRMGGVQADEGDEVSLTAVTNIEGYVIGRFAVKCGSTTLIDDRSYAKEKTYTFTMPAGYAEWSVYLTKDPNYVDPEPETPTTPTEPTKPTTSTEPTTPITPTEPTTPTTPIEPSAPRYEKGDVNLDDKVNTADATLVLKHAAGLTRLAGQGYINADINGDGYVNAKDATLILRMSVGLA